MALAWDPIGIGEAVPRDEYDCVVGPLLRMLASQASDEELLAFLEAELRDHFGFEPDPAREAAFVAQAMAWFRERWAGASA